MSSRLLARIQKTAVFLMAVNLSSCVWIPFVTSSYIDKKMEKIPIGTSKKEIYLELGQPYFRVTLPASEEPVEVYGYELGNYWHHEPCLLVIRRGRLVGVSKDSYELLQMLKSLRALPDADFWKSNDPDHPFPRRISN